MARLVFSPSARSDQKDILDALHAEGGLQSALKFSRRFRSLFLRLAAHPNSGAPRSEMGEGIRIGVVAPYLVIYRYTPATDTVDILTVLNGRRDVSSLHWKG